jgi:hypothetical protein
LSMFGRCLLSYFWKSDFVLGSVGVCVEFLKWKCAWELVLLIKGNGSAFGSSRS